jgi:tripartite-type tricarboxylate transporter receptor subunit TctC
LLVSASLCIAATGSQAAEAGFAEHPVRIVVPFPPGGGVDQVARLVGKGLSERIGQAVIVENRPGAGGNIGAATVARAKNDGYTLLMAPTGVLALAPLMFVDPGYSPSKDLVPVAMVTTLPQILMVSGKSEFQSLEALLAYARKNPGKLTVASSGRGTGQHLAVELFMKQGNVDFLQVPYKGSADVMRAVLGGETDMMFVDPSALPLVRAGTLRALAVTTERRVAALPDTPAIAEHIKDYEAASYYALLAPAGTPAAVIAELNAAVNETQREPARFIADAGIALK